MKTLGNKMRRKRILNIIFFSVESQGTENYAMDMYVTLRDFCMLEKIWSVNFQSEFVILLLFSGLQGKILEIQVVLIEKRDEGLKY